MEKKLTHKKRNLGKILILIIIVSLSLAYFFIPTFNSKVNGIYKILWNICSISFIFTNGVSISGSTLAGISNNLCQCCYFWMVEGCYIIMD